MVSVGVSRIGKTNVVFIDSGAKVNSSYYYNIVLEKGLLPDIRAIYEYEIRNSLMKYASNVHINK